MFFKISEIKENVFDWLKNIQANILLHTNEKDIFEQMQSLILRNIASFVQMDSLSTVNLCYQWFEGDY